MIMVATFAMIMGNFPSTIPNQLYGNQVVSYTNLQGNQLAEYDLVFFVGIAAMFVAALFTLFSNRVLMTFGALLFLGGYAYDFYVPSATYAFDWYQSQVALIYVIALLIAVAGYIFVFLDYASIFEKK